MCGWSFSGTVASYTDVLLGVDSFAALRLGNGSGV